jgi:hypothetical protein
VSQGPAAAALGLGDVAEASSGGTGKKKKISRKILSGFGKFMKRTASLGVSDDSAAGKGYA